MSEAYEFETDADIGMDEEEVKSILTSELDDAIDFIDNTISPVRAMAEKYSISFSATDNLFQSLSGLFILNPL